MNYKFSRTMKQIFKTKILNCETLVSLNIVLLLCKIRTHFPHYLPSSGGTVLLLQWVYLITVGVISAQKKMLRALTAWEENIPIAEKPMVKCVFIVLVVSAKESGDTNMEILHSVCCVISERTTVVYM